MSKKRNLSLRVLSNEIGREWKNLTNTEKEVYVAKSKIMREEYEKELLIWEEKMKSQGRTDLVRKRQSSQEKKQARVRVYFLKTLQGYIF